SFRLFQSRPGLIVTEPKQFRVKSGAQGVSEGKLRIARDSFFDQVQRFRPLIMGIAAASPVEQTSSAKIKLISRDVTGWVSLHARLLLNREICTQGLGDPLRQFALQSKKIGDFTVECFGPDIRVGACVDELRVDTETIAGTTRSSFQDMRNTQGSADFTNIPRTALKLLHRGAANNL